MSPSAARIVECRRLQWAGHVARMGQTRDTFIMLSWGSESFVKRCLRRLTRGREDNIKTDLMEKGYESRRWIEVAQHHVQVLGSATTLLVLTNLISLMH
jgi:hypothetical protein